MAGQAPGALHDSIQKDAESCYDALSQDVTCEEDHLCTSKGRLLK